MITIPSHLCDPEFLERVVEMLHEEALSSETLAQSDTPMRQTPWGQHARDCRALAEILRPD